MITLKAKEAFIKWLSKNKEYNETIITREAGEWNHGGEINLSIADIFEELPNKIKNTVIIDWFDSVGITVDAIPRMKGEEIEFEPNTLCLKHDIVTEDFIQFDSREKAIDNSITQANVIFNMYFGDSNQTAL